MTVFFRPGCEECDAFKAGLWNTALRTGSSLEVTFRSSEDPDNRAALSALDRLGWSRSDRRRGRACPGRDGGDRTRAGRGDRRGHGASSSGRIGGWSLDRGTGFARCRIDPAGSPLLAQEELNVDSPSPPDAGLALLLAPRMAIGAEASSSDSPADSEARPIDTLVVFASPPESDLPGSGSCLDEDAIRKHSYADVNRVLARVPGVYLRQEEGYGLFPNISLRGVDSLRSTKVTLMEDRVPSVPAPYSAPASYYAPNIARMRGIEVLKGSSQVRYGPAYHGWCHQLPLDCHSRETSDLFRARCMDRRTRSAHTPAPETHSTPPWDRSDTCWKAISARPTASRRSTAHRT